MIAIPKIHPKKGLGLTTSPGDCVGTCFGLELSRYNNSDVALLRLQHPRDQGSDSNCNQSIKGGKSEKI